MGFHYWGPRRFPRGLSAESENVRQAIAFLRGPACVRYRADEANAFA
jgi:hypothetical protein